MPSITPLPQINTPIHSDSMASCWSGKWLSRLTMFKFLISQTISKSEEINKGLIYLRDLLAAWEIMPWECKQKCKAEIHCIKLSLWTVIHTFKWLLRAMCFLPTGIKKEFEVSGVGLVECISLRSKCNLSLAKYLRFSKTKLWIFIRPLLCSTRGVKDNKIPC